MIGPGPIRTLLVDDEAPARSRLRHLLKAAPDFVVVGEAASGRQALEALRDSHPELVFLDVQMPGLNGIEVCREAGPEVMPAVVFVTAYDRFALQAFEVHAVDYLLKPIDRDRFARTLDHLRARLRGPTAGGTANPQLMTLLGALHGSRPGAERLAIKVEGRVLFVRTAEIDWLEAEGNYVKLHTGSVSHLFRDTLSALEADLPPDRFLRISRSAIVNLDAVKELQPLFYGDYAVLLRNGQQLTLSRTHRDRIERLLERRR
jgi:two-component system LytT family response regulator